MTSIVIMKSEDGRKLIGISEEQERAYHLFKRRVADMEPGETMIFTWDDPRSPRHHRKLMAKLRTLLARTEAFTRLDDLRLFLTVGAGYVEMVPGPDSTPNAIPLSLEFGSMDEADFAELHRRIDDFLRLSSTTETLWPHLTERAQSDAIESFFYAVEQRQEQQV